MRLLVMISALAAPVAAGAFSLSSPIDCDLGEVCYIQQFVDRDPTSGLSDFRCSGLTYDGHKGTDFALPSLAMQAEGVNVLAAADGLVTGVRDEMPDVLQTGPDAPDVTDGECGNGLVINHGDGWETQYCHLALGSVIPRVGQEVSTGEVIGQVGLSGQTQFPHVHLSVRKDGDVIDPFDTGSATDCTASGALWSEPINAPDGGIVSVGFAPNVPNYDAVKAGTATTLPSAGSNLVIWGLSFGTQVGDLLTLSIDGPDGFTFTHEETLDRAQAQTFRAAGKRLTTDHWPAGAYNGTVTMTRNGELLDSMSTSFALD